MTGMSIDTADLAGITIATPTGRLDLSTYASLRDGLVKCATDEPLALVVRLGPDFEVPSKAMLAVFSTVWMRISQWPDIPMVLLADTTSHLARLRTSGVSRFVRTVNDLREALIAAERPPPRRFRRVSLPHSPTAPMLARAVVREVCDLWDLARLTDDATLVVSELVENALQHAHSASVLRLELRPGGLSLALSDDDPAPPRLIEVNPSEPGHRGVQLLDMLCKAWGCTPSSDGGKIVWAVLRLRADE